MGAHLNFHVVQCNMARTKWHNSKTQEFDKLLTQCNMYLTISQARNTQRHFHTLGH